MTTTDAHPWPEARPSAPEELDGPFALCVPMQVQMARFHELRTRDPSAAAASLEWGKKLADLAARGELDALRAECLGAAGLSVVRPLADALFPTEGEHVDHHHSFMVQYKQGEDLGLDMHTDACDVTLNVRR